MVKTFKDTLKEDTLREKFRDNLKDDQVTRPHRVVAAEAAVGGGE